MLLPIVRNLASKTCTDRSLSGRRVYVIAPLTSQHLKKVREKISFRRHSSLPILVKNNYCWGIVNVSHWQISFSQPTAPRQGGSHLLCLSSEPALVKEMIFRSQLSSVLTHLCPFQPTDGFWLVLQHGLFAAWEELAYSFVPLRTIR